MSLSGRFRWRLRVFRCDGLREIAYSDEQQIPFEDDRNKGKGKGEQQILFEDDRKKSNGSNGKSEKQILRPESGEG